ncbi:MAG: alpha/beta hydrolase [Gammaproteobacteria bacterium]|nr:alpha/beta hydrolase [Gammaproteobacteria bacterium]MBU0787856.1 alpha/beta hydrolase [Gammaproteobacteria bacterium]MBU0817026.1 alpha/beta hydrolase [Gammaproteobacteria bacterium]MBU1787190.1 alpha/beta hydrolase [Gammaproteobacteria bacterium]
MKLLQRLSVLLCLCLASPLWAADQLISVPTDREKVDTSYWWMPRDGATATLLLISGGGGGMGFKNGRPGSDNFLIRTRDLFAARGFNVALLGLSSDMRMLSQHARTTEEHARDVLAVVKALRAASPQPVWLVGTSRGTISAVSAAILDQGQSVAGVVLTSGYAPDVLKLRDGPAGTQGVEAIRVPTLVYHHKDDGCRETPPAGVTGMVAALVAAPIKKLQMVEGGGSPYGDPCQPRGWHGYVGMEERAVEDITSWIRNPQP